MSRYYDERIQMVCNDDSHGTPVRFIWRKQPYEVLAVLARWHLRDRWWAAGAESDGKAGGRGRAATDRSYWRLHCASPSTAMVFCVVYHDGASAAEPWPWRLEHFYD